jgi:hypothetical protein
MDGTQEVQYVERNNTKIGTVQQQKNEGSIFEEVRVLNKSEMGVLLADAFTTKNTVPTVNVTSSLQ